ncbi:MAG: hypothetical protein NAG76_22370 [Candidatus Pristimantibacillus lignocellulolyticus]|uniref:Uncharacterized protein n=1 Tax=Candidatus Pristimantibacillus lignocellulolyticus TaxID=2994561 RepID=A0A9J6ZF75_9BACL|nr:MAG: hypothetical protein NAG76_22370 [Candidatus Pristimantibacillus lignocellulolyticus]
MKKETQYEDLLVKVELRSPHKIMIIAVNEEFQDKVVIALKPVIRDNEKAIKVTFEDETYTWIDCPVESFIYRTYIHIAVDGPTEE